MGHRFAISKKLASFFTDTWLKTSITQCAQIIIRWHAEHYFYKAMEYFSCCKAHREVACEPGLKAVAAGDMKSFITTHHTPIQDVAKSREKDEAVFMARTLSPLLRRRG